MLLDDGARRVVMHTLLAQSKGHAAKAMDDSRHHRRAAARASQNFSDECARLAKAFDGKNAHAVATLSATEQTIIVAALRAQAMAFDHAGHKAHGVECARIADLLAPLA